MQYNLTLISLVFLLYRVSTALQPNETERDTIYLIQSGAVYSHLVNEFTDSQHNTLMPSCQVFSTLQKHPA